MRFPFLTLLVSSFCLALSACGGGGGGGGGSSSSSPSASGDPTLNTDFPAMANNAAPGASAGAISAAAALGRGVNFGNIFEAPREGDWGLSFVDSYVDDAWNAGFRSVRLPVRWSNHAGATAPFTIDATFAARVKYAVDLLLAKGFYVVLNMHHYRQLDGDDRDPNEFAVDASILERRFLMMWQQIAQAYSGYNDHLIFELYNEPHGRLQGEPWNVLAARAMNVVRATNPTRPVMIGPTTWNNAYSLPNLKLPNDANLIATIHHYEPFNFTHQGASWVSPPFPTGVTCCNSTQINQIIDPLAFAKTWSDQKHYPIYVGEFGAFSAADATSRETFTRRMRTEAEARGFTWSYWEYASGFGVYNPATSSFRTGLLNALVGP